jgi:hypothetical protein
LYAHELEDLVLDLEARVTALEAVAPPGDVVASESLADQEAQGRTEAITFEEAPS